MVAGVPVVSGYPLLPWAGLMAVGFAAGGVFDLEPARRQRLLVRTGLALVVAFLVWHALNLYGDPNPWTTQASPVMTVLSFLRTTKYPPSLLFVLMTLGPVLLALAWFERRPRPAGHPLVTIGRVRSCSDLSRCGPSFAPGGYQLRIAESNTTSRPSWRGSKATARLEISIHSPGMRGHG